MKKPVELEVDILSVSYGGRGVARIEGGEVVFVRGGLPGDRVLIALGKRRRRVREGRILELIKPSPFRIEAECKHQDICGGCPLQCLEYDEQLKQKQQMLTDAFKRIGRVEELPLEEILPAKEKLYYRNKMEFTFSDQQWLREGPVTGEHEEHEKQFGLGQHVPGIHSKVFDLQECYLQSEPTAAILDCIRNYVREKGGGTDAVWNYRSNSGFWKFVVIREGKYTGDRMINFITEAGDDPRVTELSELLLKEFPTELTTIINTVNSGKSQVAAGILDKILFGPGYIREELDGKLFEIAPASFFQTNTKQAERLFKVVADFADPQAGDTLLDLYCGAGSIGIVLSKKFSEVCGVEIVPEAIDSAVKNAEANSVDNCVFHCGDVKDLLRSGTIKTPDVLILDPPRAGLSPKVVKSLLEMSVQKIVYVSCNPSTQARDAALLIEGGYSLMRLRAVDMFPQTYHVESVALFHLGQNE
jgi:23S rRNA (uracil1939-C5)-methyltransferase